MGRTLEQLADLVNADMGLVRRGRFLTTVVLIEVGTTQWLATFVEGRVTRVRSGPFVMPSWAVALRAPEPDWALFWSADPPPGSHDLMALIKRRALKVEGDLKVFMANLRYFKDVMAKLRAEGAAA
jgi:hypothetical protein